ncbi:MULTISPECIES: LPXTG cell wall anchor domain-containing protein [unclassified Adlercreutzia]|uniref:LPXTG cell wall anchor domain-containing protein n=1 Tax=unclassified Adlercreutzia TaxID=2636013 RepID=UPI0013EA47BC|nr:MULTISPECIES: LPXTG cell wall anchor domain-containing protein [unclassified Adlercreutzia]
MGSSASASSDAGGKLDVADDVQVWSSETQVDLFKGSYDGNVASADGDKLLAPGTTSSYAFTLRNNADVSLGYEVVLKVDTWSESQPADAATIIPLEWRLLDASGAPVSDWQLRSSEEVLDSATLGAGRQAKYAIEWRWPYEQDTDAAVDAGASSANANADAIDSTDTSVVAASSADAVDANGASGASAPAAAAPANADDADTAHGDRAVREDFGATATILVRAEQVTNPARPDDPTVADDPAATKDPAGNPTSDASASPKTPWDIVASWLPQTGDAALATLAAGLAGAAALALLVIVVALRRRRKEDAGDARP